MSSTPCAGHWPDHGLAEVRGIDQYALHGCGCGCGVKGSAGSSARDWPAMRGAARHDRGGRSGGLPPRRSDRNIAIVAEDGADIYKPSRHVDLIRDSFERQGKEPEAFVRFHLRRLEALRRAGHTERIDKRVPNHIVERSMAHDLSQGGDSLRVLTLSTFDLEQQIGSDGAT
jgi:hypothetical protein